MTCEYCEILKTGQHLGGNELYKIIAYDGKIYGILNEHKNLRQFKYSHGKMTTKKIDTRLRAEKELGGNLDIARDTEKHLAYIFKRRS